MNQQDLMKFRWKIASHVKEGTVKWNVVKLNSHNSWQHEEIKTRICYLLQFQGKKYITEAKLSFGKQGIGDILVLDTGQIIEIMVSETINQLEWKVKKFPKDLEIIAVTSYQDFIEEKYRVIQHGQI